MISCNVADLRARCVQRGYTFDEVSACIVSRNGDAIVVDETHPAYPLTAKPQTRGLGDMVSAGLAAVGITPERVSKAIGRPCGCKERAAKLNALGRRLGIG